MPFSVHLDSIQWTLHVPLIGPRPHLTVHNQNQHKLQVHSKAVFMTMQNSFGHLRAF